MRPYQRKLNQFRKLSRELNELLQSGEFFRLSSTHRQRLVSQLKELFYRLSQVFSEFRLKKILAGAVVLIGLGTAHTATAQTFGPPQHQPFGIQSQQYIFNFAFADLDDDGDDDLLVVNRYGQFQYQENTGTPQSPAFGTPVPNPFNISGNSLYGEIVELVDLDNDGDFDLVVMDSYYGDMLYFENIGTPQLADFTSPVTNPYGFITPSSYHVIPAFADLDNDGDLDLFLGGVTINGNVHYYENTGTPQQPMWVFSQTNPFGLSLPANVYLASPTMADLDLDGDIDLLMGTYTYFGYGSYSADFYFYENTGTPLAADWSDAPQQNPFSLSTPQAGNVLMVIPKFVDLDNDGDMDIVGLAYDYYLGGSIYYYENQSILPGIAKAPADPGFTVLPNPATEDLTIDFTKYPGQNQVISLYNFMGQLIIHEKVQEQRQTLKVGHLPSGTYLVCVAERQQTVIIE